MARRVRDASLESRAARGKLKPQGKPYYKAIGEGLHLGYRKGKVEGKWVVRRYAGDQSYITDTIATADDIEDADGDQVLNFWQAQEKAREIGGKLVYSGPYRVQDALDAYLDHLGPRSEPSSRYRNHILSPLGDVLVDELTADRLRAWLKSMVRGDSEEAIRKSQCSANRVWTVLRAALNLAFAEGKVRSDGEWRRVKPFKGVDKAKNSLSIPCRMRTAIECLRTRLSAAGAGGSGNRMPLR